MSQSSGGQAAPGTLLLLSIAMLAAGIVIAGLAVWVNSVNLFVFAVLLGAACLFAGMQVLVSWYDCRALTCPSVQGVSPFGHGRVKTIAVLVDEI